MFFEDLTSRSTVLQKAFRHAQMRACDITTGLMCQGKAVRQTACFVAILRFYVTNKQFTNFSNYKYQRVD